MSDNTSGNTTTFGFGGTDSVQDKQNTTTPDKPSEESKVTPPIKETAKSHTQEVDEALNEPYVDHRTITIALARNYSKYREANRTALPRRVDYIGGCVTSSRTLSANEAELKAYFPRLIGLSFNNEGFINAVKKYLNNIQIKVPDIGKEFNISFRYNHKKDYNRIAAQEEAIENEYRLADRNNIVALRKALAHKLNKINELESSKCLYGEPVNIEDYLMYRHCLLYSDIAKDMALINSDPSIRFYFKDNKKEEEKLRRFRLEVNKAKANYVQCIGDPDLFNAVYIQYCNINNLPVMPSLREDQMQKEIKLDEFSRSEPIKFNKLVTNRDVKLMGTIEQLIARGELIRSQYNQQITDTDGNFIGANMSEAIAWFKNVDNTSVVEVLHNKLKNI